MFLFTVFPQGRFFVSLLQRLLVFYSPCVGTSSCLSYLLSHVVRPISQVTPWPLHFLFPFVRRTMQLLLSHPGGLHGSHPCSSSLMVVPDFSTTLISNPCLLISCRYFLCNSESGVAGTKMTNFVDPFLIQIVPWTWNKIKEVYWLLTYTNAVTLVFQTIWLIRYLWLMDKVDQSWEVDNLPSETVN